MKIFIVLSLYNESKHISNVLTELAKYKFPVVVVNDGSRDGSEKKVGTKAILLNHNINLGKGAAMKTGAEYAFANKADAVIFMDSDEQHNPKDLSKFTDELKNKKVDVVFGSRNLNMGVPLVRYLGNKTASIILKIMFGIYVSDAICGFRAVTKEGYKKIKWESSGYGVETEMIARVAKNKLRFSEVPVETIYHDNVKGVTLLDAFGILVNVLKWKIII